MGRGGGGGGGIFWDLYFCIEESRSIDALNKEAHGSRQEEVISDVQNLCCTSCGSPAQWVLGSVVLSTMGNSQDCGHWPQQPISALHLIQPLGSPRFSTEDQDLMESILAMPDAVLGTHTEYSRPFLWPFSLGSRDLQPSPCVH